MKLNVALKLGLIIVVVSTVLTGGIAFYNYQVNRAMVVEDARQSLVDVGRTSARMFREQDLALIETARSSLLGRLTPVNDSLRGLERQQVKPGLSREALQEFQSSVALVYLSDLLSSLQSDESSTLVSTRLAVAIPGASPSRLVVYLADAERQLYDPALQLTQHNLTGFYAGSHDGFAVALRDGKIAVAVGQDVMTLLVPLATANGRVVAALELEYAPTVLVERIAAARQVSWQLLLFGLLMALVVAAVVGFMVNQPLYLLRVGVERMKSGDFSHPIPLQRQDEFGALAQGLNELAQHFSQHTAQITQQVTERDVALSSAEQEIDRLGRLLRDENQDLGSERAVLMQMRQASFPDATRLARFKGWDIALHFQLTSRLAGEFFDVIEGPDQQVWFCFGSVSGYGLETSLMALQVHASLTGLLKLVDGGRDPAAVLARLNAELCDVNERYGLNRHVNLLLMGQQGSRNLALTGQYENPWMFRAGGAEQTLEANALGVPLGVSPDTAEAFKKLSVNLEGADVLVLMSSGWLALLDKQDAHLERQLKKLIKLNVSLSSAAISELILKAMEPILREVKKEGVAYPDDLALVVLKRKAAA